MGCSLGLAQPVVKTMKRLPDTGQTLSYTNSAGEDADYNIYPPFYTDNGDGTVTRNYGLAQIARGETQEGFRNVVRGYALETGLIKRPLRIEDLGGKVGFERMLDAASSAAAGSNSAEGWATVALLQHASGNKDATVAALQKARDAGLNQSTLDQFTLELVKPSNGS